VEFFQDWKAADAEREFQTAIALEPNSALARHWYGSMLLHEGRFAEAVTQLDYAQRLVPSSTSILLTRGMALAFAGHRAQGIDLLRQIGAQDLEFSSVHLRLGTLSLLEPHDVNLFLSETETWAQVNHDPTTFDRYRTLERAFQSGGEPAMWKTLLVEEKNAHPFQMTGDRAVAEAELGNKDQAFSILQDLADRRAPEMIGINLRPQLWPLHSDPRYNDLLESMGLPPLR
jgi:tetratricopeptide (TPR) repeat protein